MQRAIVQPLDPIAEVRTEVRDGSVGVEIRAGGCEAVRERDLADHHDAVRMRDGGVGAGEGGSRGPAVWGSRDVTDEDVDEERLRDVVAVELDVDEVLVVGLGFIQPAWIVGLRRGFARAATSYGTAGGWAVESVESRSGVRGELSGVDAPVDYFRIRVAERPLSGLAR